MVIRSVADRATEITYNICGFKPIFARVFGCLLDDSSLKKSPIWLESASIFLYRSSLALDSEMIPSGTLNICSVWLYIVAKPPFDPKLGGIEVNCLSLVRNVVDGKAE